MKKIISLALSAGLIFSLTGCGNPDTSPASSEQRTSQAAGDAAQSDASTKSSKVAISYEESGYPEAPVKAVGDFFAMDTAMSLTVYAKDETSARTAIEAGAAEINRLDDLFSTNKAQSLIYKLNESGNGTMNADGKYLMEKSLAYYETTGGVFDIAIYPVVKAWGFTTQHFQVPKDEEIQKLLPICRTNLVSYDANTGTVHFEKPGMGIDFGGIAKGYASHQLLKIFEAHRVRSALCSLGGNVQLLNKKPDGSDYTVALQNPFKPDGDYAGTVKASGEAVITSGSYQRFFEEGGKRYHHIIDPATGHPAESGLVSATVLAKDGTMADAYATALFVMGLEKGSAFWRQHADEFEMILIDEKGGVHISEGLTNRYKPHALTDMTVIQKDGDV